MRLAGGAGDRISTTDSDGSVNFAPPIWSNASASSSPPSGGRAGQPTWSRTSAPGCTGPIPPDRRRTPCPTPLQRWPLSREEQLSPSTAGDTGRTFPLPDHARAFAVMSRFGRTVRRKARGICSSLPGPTLPTADGLPGACGPAGMTTKASACAASSSRPASTSLLQARSGALYQHRVPDERVAVGHQVRGGERQPRAPVGCRCSQAEVGEGRLE
jgi:hypothetical protein